LLQDYGEVLGFLQFFAAFDEFRFLLFEPIGSDVTNSSPSLTYAWI